MKIDLDQIKYISETRITIRKSRRRITVPKEVVDYFGTIDGDRFIWILFNDGTLNLVPMKDNNNSIVQSES